TNSCTARCGPGRPESGRAGAQLKGQRPGKCVRALGQPEGAPYLRRLPQANQVSADLQVQVRELIAADVDAFLALIDALAEYEHLPPPDASAHARLSRDVLSNPPRFFALLAELGGRPVGYA